MVDFKVTTRNNTIYLEDELRGFWISFQDEELASTVAARIEAIESSLTPHYLWTLADFRGWSKGAHVVQFTPDSQRCRLKAHLSDSRDIEAGCSLDGEASAQDLKHLAKWLRLIGLGKIDCA
jgi:hypothetical protein